MKRLFRRLQAVEKLQNREKGISRSLSQNNSMEGLLQYSLEEAGFQIETVLTEILRPDRKSSAAFGRVFGIHVIRSHLSLLLDFKSFLPNAFS